MRIGISGIQGEGARIAFQRGFGILRFGQCRAEVVVRLRLLRIARNRARKEFDAFGRSTGVYGDDPQKVKRIEVIRLRGKDKPAEPLGLDLVAAAALV